jgi:hypothetical protein
VTDATEKAVLGPPSVSFFTLQHLLTVLQQAFHRFTNQNNADPGLLSAELHDILDGFTQMEEMLCSRASPCFLMWVSKGGQYKARGNVITFSQDISQLCTTLPRLPEELDVLIVRRTDSTDTASYKDFRVRKNKVFRLLHFLKEHNQFYSDVIIRPRETVNLPDDASVLHCLPVTEPRGNDSVQPASDTAVSDPDTTPDDSVCHELAHEQNSFVPSLTPLPSEQEAITTAMTDNGLALHNNTPLPWPPTGAALSEYTTHGLFSMACPTLFPLGPPVQVGTS